MEKCKEQQQELHIIFVDLVKAFDTVNREIMWQLLGKIDMTPKIVNIIKSLHDVMRATVQVGSGSTSGLCQGFILAA